MGKRNTRLFVLIVLELFLAAMAWAVFSNLGKLGLLLQGTSIALETSEILKNLNLLLAVLILLIFLLFLLLIFRELYLIAEAKKSQAAVQNEVSDTVTLSEEETEEQRIEKEQLLQQQYEIIKRDLFACLEEKLNSLAKNSSHKIISEKALSCIAKSYEITQAEIYIRQTSEEEDKLILSSTFAFYVPEEKVFEFIVGEGLIGQVAKAGKSLLLDSIPEGYMQVKSGLGSATPSHLLICPWKNSEGDVFAVVEIAAFKAFNPKDIAVIEDIAQIIATKYI